MNFLILLIPHLISPITARWVVTETEAEFGMHPCFKLENIPEKSYRGYQSKIIIIGGNIERRLHSES